jgi:cytidine deaminase
MQKGKITKLVDAANEARKNAYVPITKHEVGAALLTTKGKIFIGCNVQSVISGLGTCAERAAVDTAVAHGEYQFVAIAIASKKPLYPCGVCLQYLAEFSEIAGSDLVILMADKRGKYEETSLYKLLPHIYGPVESHKDIRRYRK